MPARPRKPRDGNGSFPGRADSLSPPPSAIHERALVAVTRGRRGEGRGEGQPRAATCQRGGSLEARAPSMMGGSPRMGFPLGLPLTRALSPPAGRGDWAALVGR